MTNRADGRVEPGQPIRGISARAWNRAQDAADVVFNSVPELIGNVSSGGMKAYLWAHCKSTADVNRWGVIEFTDVAIEAGTPSFEDSPVLKGNTPTAAVKKWGIAVEPIPAEGIGRVAVSGVVQCKVEIKAEDDSFVTTKASATELVSGADGEGLILWKESGTGTGKWAIIRLGFSSTASIVRGTFSAPWSKGSTVTVTDAVKTTVTYTAKNYFAAVTGTGSKACAIAYVGGEWILIAAEC